jgi:hypothetical protein
VALLAQKGSSTKFTQIGKTSIGKGETKFTVKAKLTNGTYVLQLQYTKKGLTSSFSKLKTLSVR